MNFTEPISKYSALARYIEVGSRAWGVIMNKNPTRSAFSSMAMFLSYYILFAAQLAWAADVELLYSYNNNAVADSSIEQVTAIEFDNSNVLHAVSGQSGAIMRFQQEQAELLLPSVNTEESGTKRVSITGFSFLDDKSVLMVDAKNRNVLRLDPASGRELSAYGEKGRKAGMLNSPRDLTYSINKRIYIADEGGNEISVYSPSGVFLYALGQAETDPQLRLKKPTNVSVDRMERVYVLQPGRSPEIGIYEPSGKLQKHFSTESLKKIIGAKTELGAMSVDDSGRMFLADNSSGKILEFDWLAGQVKSSFGSQGTGPGQFREVTALAVSTDNRLAVLDSRNKKLDVYQLAESAGNSEQRAWLPNIGPVEVLAAPCTFAYRLNDLNVLCLQSKDRAVKIMDTQGKLLYELKAAYKKPLRATFDNEHIVILDRKKLFVFTTDGKFLTEFGASGRKEGQLGDAVDLYLQGNRIYVVEAGNKRIQLFSKKGVYLDKLPRQEDRNNQLFEKPAAIAVDSNRNIYVADEKKQKILVFSNLLEFLYEIGEPAESPGVFRSLSDLAIDSDNNLYVLTQTALKEQTIQVYRGPEKVFEFGSYSKSQDAGIGNGVTISVSPTSKTLVSVFDDSDSKNSVLISFSYLRVPSPVSGLEISGGDALTELRWQRVPGTYTEEYRVYAAKDTDGEYKLVKSSKDIKTTLEHEGREGYPYFRISAVNGFGNEGPLSQPRENVYYTAKQFISQGEIEKAIAILKDDLQINPDQPRTHRLLGKALLHDKQYTEAAGHFEAMRAYQKYAVDGLNLQVNALYLNKDYTEAMALAQDAVKLAADDVSSYINCGRLSLKIGDAVGAFVCLEDGLKLDPANSEILFLMAESHIQLGTTDQGLKLLDKAIVGAPDDAELWCRSGDVYLKLGQPKKAREQYSMALKVDSESTNAQLGLAQAYMELKDWKSAKLSALKLAGNPDSEANGNYLLGLMAIKENKPAQAVIPLSKASRADPDNVDAWLALADAYVALDKREDTIKNLQSAVNADPASFTALKRLGIMLLENKNYAEAADALIRAERLNASDFTVNHSAAKALFEAKQYLQAAEYSQKAIKLNDHDSPALTLAASIAQQRGKIGEAIEYLKTAISLDKNSYELHVQLAELYLENNLYDQAKPVLQRATVIDKSRDKAFVLLGNMYLSRRLFDQSIAAYEQAVKNNPSTDNKVLLDTAYAEKKRSLEFSSNAPQLVLEDLNIKPVFSAAYKQYTGQPIGSVKVRNISGTEYGNLKLSFEVKGYMDFPSSQDISKLAPNSVQELPLSATFNNHILEIDEDTGVQVEVKLSFVREGRNDHMSVTQPMIIYGKNAMLWSEPDMIGSFVTPKDDNLRVFVRQVANEFKPETGPLSEHLLTAMTLFSAFSAHGIRYEIDPNNPFLGIKEDQVDYVQFGRETLRLKSGDCDDLSVLFSAALESMGIETAILDVPGHLLTMFNTNLPVAQSEQISRQDDLLVPYEGKVWVPLEVTMIGTSFSEAWAEGAKKVQKYSAEGSLKTIPLKLAWEKFQPVTLKPASYEIKLPEKEKVISLVGREQRLLLQKSLDRLIDPYLAILATNPDDQLARMQIAIIYARNGLHAMAMQELDTLAGGNANNSAVHNNRGNIYLAQGDFLRAREAYEQAERLDPSDGGIKLNLAIVGYQQGEIAYARTKFKQAKKLNKALVKEYATFDKLLKS